MNQSWRCFGCGHDFGVEDLYLCGATAECLEFIGGMCTPCMDAHQICHALALEQLEVATLWLN